MQNWTENWILIDPAGSQLLKIWLCVWCSIAGGTTLHVSLCAQVDHGHAHAVDFWSCYVHDCYCPGMPDLPVTTETTKDGLPASPSSLGVSKVQAPDLQAKHVHGGHHFSALSLQSSSSRGTLLVKPDTKSVYRLAPMHPISLELNGECIIAQIEWPLAWLQ